NEPPRHLKVETSDAGHHRSAIEKRESLLVCELYWLQPTLIQSFFRGLHAGPVWPPCVSFPNHGQRDRSKRTNITAGPQGPMNPDRWYHVMFQELPLHSQGAWTDAGISLRERQRSQQQSGLRQVIRGKFAHVARMRHYKIF